MSFKEYLKDKHFTILVLILETLFIAYLLSCFKIQGYLILIVISLNVSVTVFAFIYNFQRKKGFYNSFLENIKNLDQKYYVLETIEKPSTYEERIMVNALYDINKSMIENIKNKENNLIDFKEFVELWIHEVKLPISSLVLKCHNHKDKFSEEFLAMVRKLDNYVDQVLYYIRSEDTEKDFIISEVNLKEVIKNVALKNKDDLLENEIALEVNVEPLVISTDGKWLEYIVNQIVNNSIKYKKDNNSIIRIESKQIEDKIILSVFDNGIGIPVKDINNVFNKSFTGSNGRNKTKSTGMGLYIVKKLIDKLGHQIKIESKENEYTTIYLTFKRNDLYKI